MLAKGDLAEAEPIFRNALALNRKRNGSEDAGLSNPLNGLGEVLRKRGRFAEAEPLLRQALALQRKQTPQRPDKLSGLVCTLSNLGAVLLNNGDPAGAEALLREALSIQASLPGVYFARKALAHILLAEVLRARGDLAGAEKLLIQAQGIVQTTKYWPPPELRREIIENLVAVYGSWAKTDPAKAALAAEWQQKLADFNSTLKP